MCGVPSAATVLITVSKIASFIEVSWSGRSRCPRDGARPPRLHRAARLGPVVQIPCLGRDRTAPVQWLVLHVAFAEAPGDLRMREFDAHVERLARVVLEPQSRPALQPAPAR